MQVQPGLTLEPLNSPLTNLCEKGDIARLRILVHGGTSEVQALGSLDKENISQSVMGN